MQRFANTVGSCALVLALTALTSCSEYFERHDGISVYAGNAPATNRVVQMIDPWPRAAADRNITYDGAVIGRAVARYRSGHVIPPHLDSTSSTYQDNGQAAQAADPAQPGGSGPTAAASK